MKKRLFVWLAATMYIPSQAGNMVDRPFFTNSSRMHFAQCFTETSQEDLERLKNITSYGYLDFPDATSCTTSGCNPDLKEFKSTRVIRFDASQVSPETIVKSVHALEGGDCSYNRVLSFSNSVSRNEIRYQYVPYHKERSCNYGVIFDKGTAQADVTTTISLGTDFSTITTTSVTNKRTTNNFSFGNAFTDALFGGLLLGPVGLFIGAVSIPEVQRDIESKFSTSKFDINFAKTGINFYEYSKVQKRLDKLGHTTPLAGYATDRPASGFTNDAKQVEVFQSAQVLDLVRIDFIKTRDAELEFLRTLSEVDGKIYTVRPGDNLWKIVQREYLDARLFVFISDINKIKNRQTLKVGQVLTLPRWHQLCKYFGGNPEAVEKGESLWSKSKNGEISSDFRKIKTYSGKKDLIYPLEILKDGQTINDPPQPRQ